MNKQFHLFGSHEAPQIEINNAHDNSVWDLAWHPVGYLLCRYLAVSFQILILTLFLIVLALFCFTYSYSVDCTCALCGLIILYLYVNSFKLITVFLAVGAMIMLQSSGVETGLVILHATDTTVASHKVEFSSIYLIYPVIVIKL